MNHLQESKPLKSISTRSNSLSILPSSSFLSSQRLQGKTQRLFNSGVSITTSSRCHPLPIPALSCPTLNCFNT